MNTNLFVNKKLTKILGINTAILVAYLSELQSDDPEHEFSCAQNEIENATTLSPRQQKEIVEKLKTMGILTAKLKGVPAKNYYKINYQALSILL